MEKRRATPWKMSMHLSFIKPQRGEIGNQCGQDSLIFCADDFPEYRQAIQQQAAAIDAMGEDARFNIQWPSGKFQVLGFKDES